MARSSRAAKRPPEAREGAAGVADALSGLAGGAEAPEGVWEAARGASSAVDGTVPPAPRRPPGPSVSLDRAAQWEAERQAWDRPTLLVRRTLRSGQHVRYRGNVVVLGDVNPGAEIVADGDVVVMGWLRGVVHAGASGDTRVRIAAFRLRPTQLRIAHAIARAPDDEDQSLPEVPEVAEIRGGLLVIDRWRSGGFGG